MGQKLMTFVDSLEATDARRSTLQAERAPPACSNWRSASPRRTCRSSCPSASPRRPRSEQIDEYTGSGPFIFNETNGSRATKVVYDKFDEYVPRDEPPIGLAGGKVVKVDRVEWTPIRDHQQAVNALLAGEVDYHRSARRTTCCR